MPGTMVFARLFEPVEARMIRWWALHGLFACALLAGCATPFDNQPSNVPTTRQFSERAARPVTLSGENAIGLSFSGGGVRAAAFSLGVLEALTVAGESHVDVFDDLSFISSVSGGSLTAAYVGLHGRAGLAPLRQSVLRNNFEGDLRLSLWWPPNLMRLASGGVNDRSNLGGALDRNVFHGATFADLYRQARVDVWINATDLYNRTPFPFIPPVFQGLCSDLSQLKVSEAVSASMAVPLAFAPVVLKTYPEACPEPLAPWVTSGVQSSGAVTSDIVSAAARAVRNYRDPERQRYVKLADGGLTDNQGLASLLVVRAVSGNSYGPLDIGTALRLRRMLFLIVDAGRPPVGDWGLQLDGPSGLDVALAAADASIDSATRLSAATFRVMLEAWRQELIKFRCELPRDQVRGFVTDLARWDCRDLHFYIDTLTAESLPTERARMMRNMPTRLTLPETDIDAAIEAGRDVTLESAALRQYVRDRRAP